MSPGRQSTRAEVRITVGTAPPHGLRLRAGHPTSGDPQPCPSKREEQPYLMLGSWEQYPGSEIRCLPQWSLLVRATAAPTPTFF